MNIKTLSALLLLSSTSFFSVACGGADSSNGDDADVDEAEAVSAKVTPGSFKLYPQPGGPQSPGCDVHTHLDLKANPSSTATLEERVGGMCMLAVMPDTRTYRLRLAGTQCGSRIYTGTLHADGKVSSVKITDHRSRMCMDAIPSQVIVEETRNGATTTKYGNSDAPETVTVTGKLVRSYGIGGENTGTSIQENGGLTELVLDDAERAEFVAGKTARVKGTVTSLSGVETHDRRAIDVTDMLVCPNPGWVNCMPGPQPRGQLCESDNRAWIEANCQGVGFAD